MKFYLAFLLVGSYGFDEAAWVIVAIVLILNVIACLRKATIISYVLSIVLLLSAVPATLTTEVTKNGHTETGYLSGIVIVVVGIIMIALTKKRS